VISLGEHFSSLLSISSQVASNIGEKVAPRRNSLTPDQLTDVLLGKIRKSLREKHTDTIFLPDTSVAGISLMEGKLVGLDSMARAEMAVLDERPDKVYLSLTLQLTNLVASYVWRRKKMRGELSAVVGRVNIKMKIRQERQGEDGVDIIEFSVGVLEEVTVDLKGLGFLNWVVKKVMEGVVRQSISSILMTSAKEVLRKEFSQVSLLDQMFTTFKIL